MPTEIHLSSDLTDPELAPYLQEQISMAIGSLCHQLDYVEVGLRNDPTQTECHMVCDIDMKLSPRGWIYVNARGNDYRPAIDLAAQRARAVLQKTIPSDT